MGMKSLAEAIIMQSITDLWKEDERESSLKFFKGEDFSVCAEMAGMDLPDQIKLMTLVNKSVKHGLVKKKIKKSLPKAVDMRSGRIMKESSRSLSMAL